MRQEEWGLGGGLFWTINFFLGGGGKKVNSQYLNSMWSYKDFRNFVVVMGVVFVGVVVGGVVVGGVVVGVWQLGMWLCGMWQQWL